MATVGPQDRPPPSGWRFVHKGSAVELYPHLLAAKPDVYMGRFKRVFPGVYVKDELTFPSDDRHQSIVS